VPTTFDKHNTRHRNVAHVLASSVPTTTGHKGHQWLHLLGMLYS
jgi:hypothetical protein